jgi:3-dehydroquinate synthase
MLLALELSARRGWIAESEVSNFRELLLGMHLPIDIPGDMDIADFLTLMSRDKKVVDGRLRLVLLRDIGEACIVDDTSEGELRELLQGAKNRSPGLPNE